MGGDTSKPFTLEEGPTNFLNRARHFYGVTDPRTLTVSTNSLKQHKANLEQFRTEGIKAPGGDAEMWESKRFVEAAYHPDTGKIVPVPFRFAAFSAMNIPIASSMLSPVVIASTKLTLGVHLFNQLYNASINYANRNASDQMPLQLLIQAFAAAVVTSCSIALGATWAIRRVPPGGIAATITRATIPFLAVAGSGAANLYFIRQNEYKNGVEVFDEEGTSHGKSIAAGQRAITKCCAARVLWNIPIMVFPPVAMGFLTRSVLRKAPLPVMIGTEVGLVCCSLFGGVPLALAIFPQKDSLPTSKLESKFQKLTDSQGKPIERLWFNKGL